MLKRPSAEHAVFGLPEVKRGLIAAAGGLVRLGRQLSRSAALEIAMTGDPIDAQRAYAVGLVNRVVPRDEVMNEAQKFADSVLQGAPNAIAQSKRLIEELWSTSVKEDVDLALKHHLQARESAEAREGIAAFNEKRPPNWSK